MGTILLGVGAASFIGYLIWLIICVVNWDSKIPPIIGMILSLVMIAGGLSMTPRFMDAMDGLLSKTPLDGILAKIGVGEKDADKTPEDGEPSTAEGIWYADYYLDDSQQPTDRWYITVKTPFTGTFNDIASSDGELTAELQADQEGGIAFSLYRYGNSKLINTFPDQTLAYNITMRTPDGADHSLTGAIQASEDRLAVSEEDCPAVLEALQGEGTVSFYIEESGAPMRNFLFSVPADNFSSVYQAQLG